MAEQGTSGGLVALIVEDNPGDVVLVREMLRHSGAPVELRAVETLDQADSGLEQGPVDVILLDLSLPDSEGLDSLARVHARAPDVPVIVITGQTARDLAVLAVQGLAQEYLVKGEFGAEGLVRSIHQAIERKRQQLELSRLADALRADARRFRRLVQTSSDGLLVLSTDGRVLFDNPAARAWLGDAGAQALTRGLREPLREGAELELWLPADKVAELRVAAIEWQGKQAFLGSLRDISARKAAEVELRQDNRRLAESNARLSRLSDLDPLTELVSRRGLQRALAAELERARRWGEPLGACLVSCEDLARAGDARVPAGGDELLRAVGARLRARLRKSDVLARTGAEEFLALLPSTRAAEAAAVARRLEGAGGSGDNPGASASLRLLAVAGRIPLDGGASEEALAACERKLLQKLSAARSASRSTDASPDALQRLQSASDLRAVARPIRALADRRAVGLELSVRGPEGDHEAPAALFALARDAPQRARLDLWALEACMGAAERQPIDPRLRLHVHLLPETLLEQPARRILDLLRPELRPGGVWVELSEQRLVGDPARWRPGLEALSGEGVHVALAEVGAGRGSLEAVLLLRPELLVVDRALIEGLARDPARQRALARLAQACAALGCRMLAEGVSARADLEAARAAGIDEARGDALEPAVPLPALAAELLRRP